MSRKLIGSVIGALAVAGSMAPVAQAGTPAKVTVRAEAPGRTLLATTLTTTRQQITKDGNAAHTCSGTSVAGAIEQATGGKWKASWFDGLGYAVDAIDGVKAPADFSAYWTLWINGKSSTTGICDTELQPGDDVLEFMCTPTPDFSSCTNRPLALTAGRVRKGRVTVKAVALKGDGTNVPVAGAVVHGGAKDATTAADGSVSVTLRTGQTALRATHAGDVPSATVSCLLGDQGGSCGSTDRTPPTLGLKGIRDGQAFAASAAPRELRGVARDPGGVAVALRLTRRAGGRCWTFDGERGAFRRCGAKPAPLFDVGDRTRWSYLLPARLASGSYALVVRATDDAGNATTTKARFTVEAAR